METDKGCYSLEREDSAYGIGEVNEARLPRSIQPRRAGSLVPVISIVKDASCVSRARGSGEAPANAQSFLLTRWY